MIMRILRPFMMPCSRELTAVDWIIKVTILSALVFGPTLCDAFLHGSHAALAAWGIKDAGQ